METSAWLYPWDIADHGIERLTRVLRPADPAAINVAASYHSLFATVPDNDRRRHVELPGSAVYFRPDPRHWRDAPRPAVSPMVEEVGDALVLGRRLADAAGCALTAWLVCLHSTALGRSAPELAVRTVWDEPVHAALCVVNPVVRRYARALVADAASRADRVQLESAHWASLPHHRHAKLTAVDAAAQAELLTVCFCSWCRQRAAGAGIDVARLIRDLRVRWDATYRNADRKPLGGLPDYQAYRELRRGAVTDLAAELVAASPVPVEFVCFGDLRVAGVDPVAIRRAGASIRALAYGSPQRVREVLAGYREPVHVGLSLLPEHTVDAAGFTQSVAAASESGALSIAAYHLGLVSDERRGWLATLGDRAAYPSADPATLGAGGEFA